VLGQEECNGDPPNAAIFSGSSGDPPDPFFAIMDWAAFHSIELLKVTVRDMRAQAPMIRVPVLLSLLQSAATALTMVFGFLDPPGAHVFPRINAYAQSIAAQTVVIAGACALDDLSGLQESEHSPHVRELIKEARLQLKQEAEQLSGYMARYICGCTMVEASRIEKALQGTISFMEKYLMESPDPMLEDVAAGLVAVNAKVAEIRDCWPQTMPMVESAGS